MTLSRALAAALLPLVAACTRPASSADGASGPRSSGQVTASATAGMLRIRNGTDQTIYFRALEGDFAATSRWAPCSQTQRCARIAPRSEAALTLASISGYREGASTAVIHWWHLRPDGEGSVAPGGYGSLRVQL